MVYSTTRIFCINNADSVNELATLLRFNSIPLCWGFRLGSLHFFNDTSPALNYREFAVLIREGAQWFQVDTLTVNIMEVEELKKTLNLLQDGLYPFKEAVEIQSEERALHRCHLCENS